MAVVVAVFTVIVIGCTFWGWGTNELSAMMISCGIIVSVFSKTDFQSVIKHANKSVTSVAGMIIIIVMANAIGLILTEGMIVSTIIHARMQLAEVCRHTATHRSHHAHMNKIGQIESGS